MRYKGKTPIRPVPTPRGFGALVGTVLSVIDVEDDRVTFTLSDGRSVQLFHEQNCCETVLLHNVNSSWTDLLDSPILFAEESSNLTDQVLDSDYNQSHTWTFYRIGTVKGTVVMRWLGTSNGYCSESVNVEWYDPDGSRWY